MLLALNYALKAQLCWFNLMEESDFTLGPFRVDQLLNWSSLKRSSVSFFHFTFAVLSLKCISTTAAFVVLSAVVNSLQRSFEPKDFNSKSFSNSPSKQNSQPRCNDATRIVFQRDNFLKVLDLSWKWFRNVPCNSKPENRNLVQCLHKFHEFQNDKPKSAIQVFSNVIPAVSTEPCSFLHHPWILMWLEKKVDWKFDTNDKKKFIYQINKPTRERHKIPNCGKA